MGSYDLVCIVTPTPESTCRPGQTTGSASSSPLENTENVILLDSTFIKMLIIPGPAPDSHSLCSEVGAAKSSAGFEFETNVRDRAESAPSVNSVLASPVSASLGKG